MTETARTADMASLTVVTKLIRIAHLWCCIRREQTGETLRAFTAKSNFVESDWHAAKIVRQTN